MITIHLHHPKQPSLTTDRRGYITGGDSTRTVGLSNEDIFAIGQQYDTFKAEYNKYYRSVCDDHHWDEILTFEQWFQKTYGGT